jgi:DNA-binding response OmpR family regulator
VIEPVLSPETSSGGSAEPDLPHVLIVDDEEPVVEILSFVVLDAGFRPITAPHGRRALEIARACWPSLLITDLMMPYLNGVDLIAALRAEATNRGLPVIPSVLITGAGWDVARRAGADVVLHKPFELDDVDVLLQRFLADSKRS